MWNLLKMSWVVEYQMGAITLMNHGWIGSPMKLWKHLLLVDLNTKDLLFLQELKLLKVTTSFFLNYKCVSMLDLFSLTHSSWSNGTRY